MFISATGAGDERGVNFAHFSAAGDGAPQLRTFSWDVQETHFYFIERVNLDALHWPQDPGNVDGWRRRWDEAFPSPHRYSITTAASLASIMAQLAVGVRQSVTDVFALEKPSGPLHRLYDSFRHVLIHDLSADDFADMYAQTVTYGLFSARATRSGQFRTDDVPALIPNTNPFLRDLLSKCLATGAAGPGKDRLDLAELGVDELVETLASTDMESILRDFGRQSRGHKEDPVVHFYDSFLHEYDPEKKLRRGVFYTPDPVVSFIVRSVDHLLRSEFGYEDGLADTGTMEWQGKRVPRVQILDPAVGTGTFLKHVIEIIYETFVNKAIKAGKSKPEWQKEWNEDYVPRHLLPRLYGFELMMAPYAVAHMKLGLALKETGYDFASDERLRVYLTNTLQPAEEIPLTDTSSVAQEAREANAAKLDEPITVIIGNPPYSGHSANKGDWIRNLVRSYYQVDGHPLGERNPKWLQDDYVKFLRYGQWCIERTGQGILAMITNHGYLDNPTFRGMRQQLMRAFSDIHVLDLHGSLKKHETVPDGSRDENVFDIQPGVAICLIWRHPGAKRSACVFHADIVGSRSDKYRLLSTVEMSRIAWTEVMPRPPFHMFVPTNARVEADYYQYPRVVDIMPLNVLGFQTHRDSLAVDFEFGPLRERIRRMRDTAFSDAQLRHAFRLKETRSWTIARARQGLRDDKRWKEHFIQCLYRPFDVRPCYYDVMVVDRPRRELLDHVAGKGNLCLLSARQQGRVGYRHAWVARDPANDCVISDKSREANQVFPLYLYSKRGSDETSLAGVVVGGRSTNLSPAFIASVESNLHMHFVADGTGDLRATFGPEDVFHYMYAVFHSPTYRTRYAEFLKIDFPRLPLMSNLELFRELAARGAQLVALHLMESAALEHLITRWVGKGDNVVARGYPKYEHGTVWVNPTQCFAGVPEDVWEFHVGGYQVCHKWLKDRRGRVLSAEDQTHYQRVVVALQETIRLMGEIDAVIEERGGWPIK